MKIIRPHEFLFLPKNHFPNSIRSNNEYPIKINRCCSIPAAGILNLLSSFLRDEMHVVGYKVLDLSSRPSPMKNLNGQKWRHLQCIIAN